MVVGTNSDSWLSMYTRALPVENEDTSINLFIENGIFSPKNINMNLLGINTSHFITRLQIL